MLYRSSVRGLLKRLITEPGADSAEDYARRVHILAATYAVRFELSDEATIRNAGWGEGVIQVDFRLRPRGGGAPLLRSEKTTLRPRETARVEVRVDGARGDEQLDVGLDYPPR